MTDWISCKDRLPEVDEDVLVYYNLSAWNDGDCWSIGIASLNSPNRRGSGEWSFYMACGSKGPVTHWQPLPAPPEDEE